MTTQTDNKVKDTIKAYDRFVSYCKKRPLRGIGLIILICFGCVWYFKPDKSKSSSDSSTTINNQWSDVHAETILAPSVNNSSNVLMPVTITKTTQVIDSTRFRAPTPEVCDKLRQSLSNFKNSYTNQLPSILLRIESGNNERYKVATLLGEAIKEQQLGSYDNTSIFMGQEPGVPMSLRFGKGYTKIATDFKDAISTYIQGQYLMEENTNWTGNTILFFISGTPIFSTNGVVHIE